MLSQYIKLTRVVGQIRLIIRPFDCCCCCCKGDRIAGMERRWYCRRTGRVKLENEGRESRKSGADPLAVSIVFYRLFMSVFIQQRTDNHLYPSAAAASQYSMI